MGGAGCPCPSGASRALCCSLQALAELSFGRSERAVRVNSVQSGHCEDDLESVLSGAALPDALVVPKVSRGADRLEERSVRSRAWWMSPSACMRVPERSCVADQAVRRTKQNAISHVQVDTVEHVRFLFDRVKALLGPRLQVGAALLGVRCCSSALFGDEVVQGAARCLQVGQRAPGSVLLLCTVGRGQRLQMACSRP